jgi:hypothetical protein
MRIIKTLALAAPLLAPQATPAADLTVQADGQVEYDSNAFRQKGEEDDDVLFRMRPQVKLHEDRGQDLRYSLSYGIPFEFAAQYGDELDDVDHQVLGEAQYHASNQLELWGRESFRYLRSALIDVGVDEALAGEGTLLVNQERERTTLNDAEVGARYQFTPRLSGSLRTSHEFFDTEREDRAENWLLSGIADLSYVVTPRHSLGGGVRVIRQEFDATDTVVSSAVNSYNAFAQWTFRIDETLSFSIAAGPTWIDNDQDEPDAARTLPQIPFVVAPAGEEASSFGLVNQDGTAAVGAIEAGSIVVSQLAGCPTVTPGQPIFPGSGQICPISQANPGILLEGVSDAALVTAAQTNIVATNLFPVDEDDTTLTAFGEAVIAKHWTETLHTALRYNRTQGGASGLGGAVVSDAVSLANTWDFAERWQIAVRGDWVMRESVSDVTQQFVGADPFVVGFTNVIPAGTGELLTVTGNDSVIETIRYGAAGRLTHRFTRNTSAWFQLTYNEQTSDGGTLGDPSDFSNTLAAIGVRHVFEPIKLW